MKSPSQTRLAFALAGGLLSAPAFAATPIFQIGLVDNSQAEFEQESDTFNNPQYYIHEGDYGSIIGQSGAGGTWTGPQEILADGPTAAEWPTTPNGFPRALVPGRPVIDIFFQLSTVQALSPALQFETLLFSLGGGSSHDVTFYLNGTPFFTQDAIIGDTPVNVEIPREGGGFTFNDGGNVISLVRDGGGVDSPWIQFDYVNLNAVPEPSLAWLALTAVGAAGWRRRR